MVMDSRGPTQPVLGVFLMIDKYTKAVLTAIATSLMVLVWQQHTTRFAFWLSQLDEKLYNLTLINDNLDKIEKCQ
jgi:hypothetical protein